MDDSQRCFERLQAGDGDGLQRILELDPAASEARDSAGVSLLMHSLYRGQRDLAELIASKKNALDVFEASALGRLNRLKELAPQSPVSHSMDFPSVETQVIENRSGDGFTALHFACFFGQPEAARWLIERGAAVNAVAANPTQVMPLHSAASARNLEAARLLLEHGALINARQQAGWAPIHAAAQNGDRPMIELLLERGADRTLANDQGKTPGMVAREKGHLEIAALLER